MDAYTENKKPDTRKGVRKGSAVICLIPADIIRKTVIPNGITVFLVRRKGLEPPTY